MAVSARVGSVALDTAMGDQTVEPVGLGFTPVGALFSGNLNTVAARADVAWFMGAAASSGDERYVVFQSEDGSASSDTGRAQLDDGCMSGMTDNDSVDYVGDFTSFNASPAGFSFNLSNAPAAASFLNYILLGGDVTGIQTFVFNLGTGTGNVSLSSLSGTPSCVIFFTASAAATDTSAAGTSNAVGMTGWMCPDGSQGVSGTRHTDAQAAGDTGSWQRTDRCIDLRSTSAELANASFVSMDANGFTVSVNTPTDNLRVYGVAIYGGTWKAGAFDSSTGTGSTAVTTTGVNPKFLLFQTVGREADTGTFVDGRRSLGACDADLGQWAVSYDDLDGQDPTVADSYFSSANAIVSITAGTPTVNDAYGINAVGTEQFTYNHNTASGTAIQVIYLAGGDTPAAGSAAPPRRDLALLGVG